MKKFCKIIFGTLSLAALAGGAYYFIKHFICKDSSDELDDLDDEFEEESPVPADATDNREYVSINITAETEAAKTETVETEAEPEDDTDDSGLEDTETENTEV